MGERRLLCPGCRSSMQVARRRGVDIDLCPDCLGRWFDAGEIGRSIGSPVPAVALRGPSARRCPVCGGGLARARMAEIEIDWCEACSGAYLDGGEFERLRKSRPPRRTRKRRMISDDEHEHWVAALLLGVRAGRP